MSTLLNHNEHPLESSGRRSFIFGIGCAGLIGSVGAKTSAKLNSPLRSISELSDDVFEEAENKLDSVLFNESEEFLLALKKDFDSRTVVIKVPYSQIENLTKQGGIFKKGILNIEVKPGGATSEFIIRGRKNGGVYRYGIIGFKDSEGVTLLDEHDDIMFGREMDALPGDPPAIPNGEDIIAEKLEKIKTPKVGKFRQKPIALGYQPIHRESRIEKGKLPDKESVKGRIIRSIRWEAATDIVEKRYGIPKGLILAMMAQEGYGDPTLPNLGNDGGLGLIHIQAINAHRFGLKTLPRYTNKMKDRRHADEINKVKSQENNDLKKLIRHDDRFHPILAIDVAARFLVEGYVRMKRRNPRMSEHELWNLALKIYSGRPYSGKRGYGHKVRAYQALITSPKYKGDLDRAFRTEYGIIIAGKSAGLKEYIANTQRMLINYGLQEYQKLPQVKYG